MVSVIAQSGAIPYRRSGDRIEVLLISTSSGKHMTIPKGIIDPGYSATETALNEALEEAGIEGRLLLPPVGAYHFEKWGSRCEVQVFALQVTRELDDWMEAAWRQRIWLAHTEAAGQVKHANLGSLILSLPERLNRAGIDDA